MSTDSLIRSLNQNTQSNISMMQRAGAAKAASYESIANSFSNMVTSIIKGRQEQQRIEQEKQRLDHSRELADAKELRDQQLHKLKMSNARMESDWMRENYGKAQNLMMQTKQLEHQLKAQELLEAKQELKDKQLIVKNDEQNTIIRSKVNKLIASKNGAPNFAEVYMLLGGISGTGTAAGENAVLEFAGQLPQQDVRLRQGLNTGTSGGYQQWLDENQDKVLLDDKGNYRWRSNNRAVQFDKNVTALEFIKMMKEDPSKTLEQHTIATGGNFAEARKLHAQYKANIADYDRFNNRIVENVNNRPAYVKSVDELFNAITEDMEGEERQFVELTDATTTPWVNTIVMGDQDKPKVVNVQTGAVPTSSSPSSSATPTTETPDDILKKAKKTAKELAGTPTANAAKVEKRINASKRLLEIHSQFEEKYKEVTENWKKASSSEKEKLGEYGEDLQKTMNMLNALASALAEGDVSEINIDDEGSTGYFESDDILPWINNSQLQNLIDSDVPAHELEDMLEKMPPVTNRYPQQTLPSPWNPNRQSQ